MPELIHRRSTTPGPPPAGGGSLRLAGPHGLSALLIAAIFLGAQLALAADPPPAAARGLLLDACVMGNNVFAVGEHGALIRSDDSGQTWSSIRLPIGGTFTGIKFADTRQGWIVGHGGAVLFSADGGLSWTNQTPSGTEDSSLLDLYISDALHVVAIGSFGVFQSTSDGGHTWKSRKVLGEDLHLNRVSAGRGTEFFVAGERGTLLRFSQFRAEPTPLSTDYQGSFNGVLLLADGNLLAYGLRGHAFRSENDGATWTQVGGLPPVLLSTAIQLKSGAIILAGQARAFLVSKDGGQTFHVWPTSVTMAVAKVLEAPDGSLLCFGEAGVNRIAAPVFSQP